MVWLIVDCFSAIGKAMIRLFKSSRGGENNDMDLVPTDTISTQSTQPTSNSGRSKNNNRKSQQAEYRGGYSLFSSNGGWG